MGRSSVFFAMAPRFKLLIFLWLVAACLGPPVEGTTQPRVEGTTKPPVEGTTQPPVEGTTQPPVEGTTKPPVEGTTQPPVEGTTKPPVEGTTKPPVEGTTQPPVEGTTKPPVEGTTQPPVEGTTQPPVEGTTKPPVEGTTQPPVEGTTKPPVEGTTKPPVEGTTQPPVEGTTKPPVEGTTKPPVEGTTKPPVEGTTKPPVEGTTKPPVEGTTKPPVEGTTKPPVEETTKPPTGTSTADPATTDPATPDPCTSNPCGQGSTCEARDGENFVCLCLAGESYNQNSGSCEKAKVFPGEVTVPGITFTEALTNEKSPEFREAAKTITDDLDKAFADNKDYTGSIVLEIKEIASRGSKASGVNAVVDITFKSNAQITTKDVENSVKECEDCELGAANFNSAALCDRNTACDKTTTTCTSNEGTFNCPCIEGYVKTNLSDRMCIACPSGEKAVGDKCEACGFGQSGFNCNESWKLILTIVGTVLGGLLLVTLILLILVASKSKKRSKKNKNGDIGDPYVSKSPAKTPLVNDNFANGQAPAANRSAGVPRIPRATSGWENRNFEMTQSNSRQNTGFGGSSRVIEDDDDMAPYAQSRPQSSLYGQARAQNNPYGRNPYASSQGQTNPYFVNDDGRRYN